MHSPITTKISNFIKKRLIELLGVALVLLSIYLFASIATYSRSAPNFIYQSENTEIKNIGGFYGSAISDFFLQSLGLISILVVINFLYWGMKLISEKKITNFFAKIFFTLAYVFFGTIFLNLSRNDSYWLVDNGNGFES